MQAIESRAPAANARYASSVIRRAADIIDETVKAGEEWTVYDALRQATDEYRATESERDNKERSYGMVPLLKDVGKFVRDHASAKGVQFLDDWTPVSTWSNSVEAETVTATLREAAPVIAENVQQRTTRVEAALKQVHALNLSEEEVLEEVRQVRGK